ncbi:uncharacterized protein TRAVEDRAFT_70877 [Trametes versicolor FP-101664 SS1]|uniref:uncharacterized protein n=1 Tax=Trametes versicolor (strain FP-101664) TaxID=717944 RepID=UPI000462277E|nr:uncharacterized protein TRAVEDRAFT_70877 [Trametes versicolor FP-101664 SS1]EIW60516.1 hypothetical protein TRAVEDRAFT_70877 [Trametes versicolor FP-101664 SS1]
MPSTSYGNGTNTSTSVPLSLPSTGVNPPNTSLNAYPSDIQNTTDSTSLASSTSSVETSAGVWSSSGVASGTAPPSSSKHSNHTGAIVGGVIGGLAFLLFATVATSLLCRRMRARRTAPSAEFMDLARGTTPGPGPVRMEGTTTPSGDHLLPLARQGSLGDEDDRPPAFTPGVYGDPVLEKVHAAAALREQYQRRDSYAAAQADYKEPLGDSEVGHEDESTEVGTEEGYGLGWDEKAGYAWAM